MFREIRRVRVRVLCTLKYTSTIHVPWAVNFIAKALLSLGTTYYLYRTRTYRPPILCSILD